jgi:hypothetical protein
MISEKGKSLRASWLLGCGLAALGAAAPSEAALVTLSGVFTNTTGAAVEKEFSHKITVTETLNSFGVFGGFSLLITNFNRNGASPTAGSGPLYSGLLNDTVVKSFTPVIPVRSMSSIESSYGSLAAPEPTTMNLRPNDEIEIRLKFTVSAGYQVAYAATFNLVPGPSAACAALLAPWIGLHRRRRTENDS